MIIVGIDPGITGAIAIFEDGRLSGVYDMPVFDGRVDGAALYTQYIGGGDRIVYLEDTHAMPKNGSIASFKLGLNTGIVIGVVQSLQHPLVRVLPRTWKTMHHLNGKRKDASRGLATELFPNFADRFRLMKHHGRAEAALIGRYGVWDTIHRDKEGA